jgi:hypothetical protein
MTRRPPPPVRGPDAEPGYRPDATMTSESDSPPLIDSPVEGLLEWDRPWIIDRLAADAARKLGKKAQDPPAPEPGQTQQRGRGPCG